MGAQERQAHSSRIPRYERGHMPSPQPEYDVYYMRMHRVWHPPTDVYETEEAVIVKVEIAGMDDEGLDISFVDRQLTVRGNRHDRIASMDAAEDAEDASANVEGAVTPSEGKVTYHNMEIHYGEFLSQVKINLPVNDAAIEARYEDGFLYVILPKLREHRIQVSIRREDDAPSG